jgi:hypothetical protein
MENNTPHIIPTLLVARGNILDIPFVGLDKTLFEGDLRLPSHPLYLGAIHKLPGCAIRLAGVPQQLPLEAYHLLHQFCKLFDGHLAPTPYIFLRESHSPH